MSSSIYSREHCYHIDDDSSNEYCKAVEFTWRYDKFAFGIGCRLALTSIHCSEIPHYEDARRNADGNVTLSRIIVQRFIG